MTRRVRRSSPDVSLFGPEVPSGFHYRESFISVEEHVALIEAIGLVEFSNFEMRGVVARRRVAFYGATYDERVTAADSIPAFLIPFRDRAAAWASVVPDAFAMALINEYSPGAPIGWHRDAPQYDIVAGISLLSSCVMRLRPYVPPGLASTRGERRITTHEIRLEPRSAYLITGEARSGYEHSIPPVNTLRYSVTFRTLRSTNISRAERV